MNEDEEGGEYSQHLLAIVGILLLFSLSYMYYTEHEELVELRNRECMCDGIMNSRTYLLGEEFEHLLGSYANILGDNETELVMDCNQDYVFKDQGYAFCFIKPRNLTGYKLITVRVNFSESS